MERISVALELPRPLPDRLQGPTDERASTCRLLIALELFQEETVSSGKAAQIAGLSKSEFIDELGKRDIPYFTRTPEELEAEVEEMRRLLDNS